MGLARDFTVPQTVMEDGGRAAKRKACSISRRRLIFFLTFLCSFILVYCFSLSEFSSNWTNQLWAQYTNTMAHIKLANLSRHWPLQTFYINISEQRTTTTMDDPSSSLPMSPLPEYKSPGPYLVEYPYKYNFIINEPKRCQELKPFLVLVVPVAPQNTADRQIIRNTWGADKTVLGKNIALFFLLGLGNTEEKELLEESRKHGDLIQSDFVDCYKNLTIKTMVMLEWLHAHCRDATYAMKIDSDIFLNLPNLVKMLQGAPVNNYLTGLVERAAMVHRHASSKWFIPFEIYSGNVYPPYALGLGYVLSLDLAGRLVEASREVKAMYIEDVYLGMCLHHLGLHPTDPPVQGGFHVFPLSYSRCQYSKIIATTLHEHTDRLQLWKDFRRPGPFCENGT